MAQYEDRIPETDFRGDFLRDCLKDLGHFYRVGEDDRETAADAAVRHTLVLPHSGPIDTPTMFNRERYQRVTAVFNEILMLGLFYENQGGEPDTREARAANEAWHILMTGIKQQDLDPHQHRMAHLTSMMTALTHWVDHTEGGVQDTVRDLEAFLGDPHGS